MAHAHVDVYAEQPAVIQNYGGEVEVRAGNVRIVMQDAEVQALIDALQTALDKKRAQGGAK